MDNNLEKILRDNTGGINDTNDAVESNVPAESQETIPDDIVNDAKEEEVLESQIVEKSVNGKNVGFFEKIVTTFACAVVFGLVAFLTFACADNLWGKPAGPIINNVQNNVELGIVESIETPDGVIVSTSIPTVAEAATPSIVSITNLSIYEVNSFFYGTQKYESESNGSGVIIGKNDKELLIITNNHVIEGNKSLTVKFANDKTATAIVKGADSKVDIAVVAVKLNDIEAETFKDIKVAQIGDSDKLVVGEPVIAIGNALGYGQSVTSGIVSAVDRKISGFETTLIQTDAAINPGNSGGALLNIKGELIGINTAKMSDETVEGMGYAIPITEVLDSVRAMMEKETREKVPEAKRGKLGISCVDVDETAAKYYNIPKGAYINEVEKDGAANKAGICKGSVITSFDGTSINGSTALVDLLAYYEKGETVTVTISVPNQDGTYESKDVQVTLG